MPGRRSAVRPKTAAKKSAVAGAGLATSAQAGARPERAARAGGVLDGRRRAEAGDVVAAGDHGAARVAYGGQGGVEVAGGEVDGPGGPFGRRGAVGGFVQGGDPPAVEPGRA